MNRRGLSADEIALLVSSARDSEESSSDDEAIGDFTSDGHSYVLSGESLAHASRATLSLPPPAERDSLLLYETLDFDDMATYEDNEDTVDNDRASNNEAEDNDNIAEDNGNQIDDSSDSEFAFTWCDIEPNFVEPDLPDFTEPVGVSSEASSAKSPLECFRLFFTSALISILVTQTNCVLLKHLHLPIIGKKQLRMKC